MNNIRVIPSLLIEDGGLVKTTQFSKSRYLGDPVNTVKIFNEKEVDELIILDIMATKEGRSPDFSLISEIASECFMPLGYGGGIRSLDDIKRLFYIGIEKAIINSHAITNPTFIREASQVFGSQSIVVSMDVKKNLFGKYSVYSDGGKQKTDMNPVEHAENMEKLGAGELIINSINNDGIMKGYDIELIKEISSAVGIPVVASGGAGGLDDFAKAVLVGGASAVAAGSLFVYQGKHKAVLISYPKSSELNNLFKG